MNDDELLRYSRHILLPEIGIEGQQRILASHAVVIGAGGLGSPALLYLASAGVGTITVLDPDTVELSNLQRQIAHSHSRIGQYKALSARSAMLALNPSAQIQALTLRATPTELDTWVPQADIVLDCSDNFATRQEVNAACVRHGKPLVFGSSVGFQGQVGVFNQQQAHGPCWACAFPPHVQPADIRCATMGIFAPLVGIIGSMQAAEALKLLAGMAAPSGQLGSRLHLFDASTMHWQSIDIQRDPQCGVCSGAHRPNTSSQ